MINSLILNPQRPVPVWGLSLLAIVFGIMTVKSGGTVLLLDHETRQNLVGHYVPFVLWFNFFAGFFYVLTAIALWLMRPWSTWLSLLLATSTIAMLFFLGIHGFNGGHYEMRTVMAMILRSGIWLIIFIYSWNHFFRHQQ